MANMPETTPHEPSQALLDPSAFTLPPRARNIAQKRKTGLELKLEKPGPADWARIHPDEAFHWLHMLAFEEKPSRKLFILSPGLYEELDEAVQRVFAENDFRLTAILNGNPILWRLKHSDTGYCRSMQQAVEIGLAGWVQIQSNQFDKLYRIHQPTAQYDEPDWDAVTGGESAQELFTRVFKERVISSVDHPVLLRIGGVK
jgi:hypothetical protein